MKEKKLNTSEPETSSAFSFPYNCSTKETENSIAVPGPRLVTTLPSCWTLDSTAVAVEDSCSMNDG